MSSQTPGKTTSELEVTNISSHGIWLFNSGEEFFLSYQDFPGSRKLRLERFFMSKSPHQAITIGRIWISIWE